MQFDPEIKKIAPAKSKVPKGQSMGFVSLTSKPFMSRKQSHQPGIYSEHDGFGSVSISAKKLGRLDSKRSGSVFGPGTHRDHKGKKQNMQSMSSSKPRYSKTKETTDSQIYGGSEVGENQKAFMISET